MAPMTRSLGWVCLIFIVPLLAESGLRHHSVEVQRLRPPWTFQRTPEQQTTLSMLSKRRSIYYDPMPPACSCTSRSANSSPRRTGQLARGYPEWLAANVDQAITEDLSNVTWLSNPTPGRIALFRAAFLNPKTLAGLREVTVDADPEVRIQVKSGRRLRRTSTRGASFRPWRRGQCASGARCSRRKTILLEKRCARFSPRISPIGQESAAPICAIGMRRSGRHQDLRRMETNEVNRLAYFLPVAFCNSA